MNTKDYVVRLEDLKRPIEENPYDPNTGNIAAYMRYLRYNTPPAEPKRIRGKWIEHEHGYWTFVNADGERDGWIPDYECDQCGSRGWKEVAPMNFCPNCGADMRGVTE